MPVISVMNTAAPADRAVIDGCGGDGAIAVLSLTRGGAMVGQRLAAALPGATHHPCRGNLRATLDRLWPRTRRFVCIMAAGIVVRAIAGRLIDKRHDPAVVVCDEKGSFAISLLSGHLGGANRLAGEVAAILGGQAVITTASDVLGHTALDCWARDLGLTAANGAAITRLMGRLVDQGSLRVFSDWPLSGLPDDLLPVADPDLADFWVTDRDMAGAVILAPRSLTVGIGCNRGTPVAELESAVEEALARHRLLSLAVGQLATAAAKADEEGLHELARRWGLPLRCYAAEELNGVEGVAESEAARRAIGVKAVAEPAALLASTGGNLIAPKMRWPNVTVAIARRAIFFGKETGCAPIDGMEEVDEAANQE